MKKSALFAVSLLLILSGCGNKAEVPTVATESIDSLQKDLETEAEEMIPETEESKDTLQTENNQQSREELEGSVKCIGESSVVVDKIFTYEEDGATFAIQAADGQEGEVSITVNFSEDVKFEIHAVKNGGVNGDADVTTREGSFADIQQDSTLHMTGYYITPDQEFMAETVIIYEFI